MSSEKVFKERLLDPVEKCFFQIEKIIDENIILLYDNINSFLFQDIDYVKIISNIPLWVSQVGISPEFNCTKDWYEKLRRNETHPIFGKFIYYYDLNNKISAIQDRFIAVMMFMRQLFDIVPSETKYDNKQYINAIRSSGIKETEAHILLNYIFVAYASIFDLMSKIAVEQFEFNKYNFSNYKKMRSADILYKKSLNNIDPSLKVDGMLFSEPSVIRQIESFRNEFIHNGTWDFRCSVYELFINKELKDVIIYSPDMDELGNFISSGSRNKFYSQANRINIQLPGIIEEATIILKNTINQLSSLYRANTTMKINDEYTKECMDAIRDYYKLSIK